MNKPTLLKLFLLFILIFETAIFARPEPHLATSTEIAAADPAPETDTLDANPMLKMAFSESIGRDNVAYHINQQSQSAHNPNHAYDVQFEEDGVAIQQGQDTWHIKLESYGYGTAQQPVAEAEILQDANRVTYQRGILDEWYVNGQMGLQQGFTLYEAPASQNQGDLTLTMTLSGTMHAELNGSMLHLSGENGASLIYGGLYTFDADGTTLPARFELDNTHMTIVVDDARATYPVTIDPWIQIAELIPDRGPADGFGVSVALDADTAVVGAWGDDNRAGSAYVFVNSDGTWIQQAKLVPVPGDGVANDGIGMSVTIDGNTALIGGYSGAYVFVRSGTTWTQQAKLDPDEMGQGDSGFGNSVALSGDTAVIGAEGSDSAYVFVRSGTTWTQQAKLVPSDGATGDLFGSSVAVSGDIALIGSPWSAAVGGGNGSAYVFVRNGSIWSQQTKLLPDEDSLEYFGESVALSGETAVVGAVKYDGSLGAGIAYVFVRSGDNWIHQARLMPIEGIFQDGIYNPVAVDGDITLVGAAELGAAGYLNTSIYVYVRHGTDWIKQSKLLSADVNFSGLFDNPVAISGNTALVGVPDYYSGGSVYVFNQMSMLNAVGFCAGTDMLIEVSSGDGPIRIGGTGPDLPLSDVSLGTHTLTGPGTWTDVTVTEVGGDGESILLGDFTCDGPPAPPTNTPTDIPTTSPTHTDTATTTPTATHTPSDTPSDVPTDTLTASHTPTDIPTVTSTPTDTPTSTLPNIPTGTPTETSSPTITPTPSGTPDPPTFTPTHTGTPVTPTDSVTLTPSLTMTYTPSFTATRTSTPSITPSGALNASATCNGPNLNVTISSGQGPFVISASAGINQPVYGVGLGTTTLIGPEKWDDLRVTETSGNFESINLGQLKCYPIGRPVQVGPPHRWRTTSPYPVFSWQPFPEASNYRVWLFDDADAKLRTVDIRENSGGALSMTLSQPLQPGRYFWRLRARVNRIWSRWSTRWALFIDSNAAVDQLPTIELNPTEVPLPTLTPAPSLVPEITFTPVPTIAPPPEVSTSTPLPPPNQR